MRIAVFLVAGVVYSLHTLLLLAFALQWLHLSVLAMRRRGPDPVAPPLVQFPFVTVQLPIYNELHVAERVIDAAAQLDWPLDRLEIQVLDDSTDETVAVVAAAVARWRTRGVPIVILHRDERVGFKAGALAAGMVSASGELLAYFDADFVPPRDFLRRTVGHFTDPTVAFVQTRWGHLNREYSLLTRVQALLLDAHFAVDHFAHSRSGYWFNFNGTAGVWRRAALEHAGGWSHDTLTEDLDLSYRAFLAGWKAVYLRDVVTPAELPVTIAGFRRQQHRWAMGGFQCAAKLLPPIWRAALPLSVKIQASAHLVGYGLHLTLFSLLLVSPAMCWFASLVSDQTAILVNTGAFALASGVPTLYYTVAQRELGGRWWRSLPGILFITLFASGMMATTVRAGWNVARRQRAVFERTPKFGIARQSQSWVGSRYALASDRIVMGESLIVLWSLGFAAYALSIPNVVMAAFGLVIAAGTLFVAGFGVIQSLRTSGRDRQAQLAPSAFPRA